MIGAGQVGSALFKVLESVHETTLRDTEPDNAQADMIHICFPWSEQFVELVQGYIKLHKAQYVVVHSTVPVGTCDPYGWVHSPIRGRHPNLYEGIMTFTKHVGGRDAETVSGEFKLAGLTTLVHPYATETEAGKLWELTQFGLQVMTQKAIYKWCVERDIDPDVVYRQFAETYNDGYQLLDEDRFVRPVLDHMPGPIGGHCVTQCAGMLDHELGQQVARGH